jgi:hypothetical protein
LVSQFDTLPQPVLHLRLHPPNPGSRTIPEAHTPWKFSNGLEASDVLRAVQCCATIKVRIPDNQDEKVVAGLVPQGGRSPTEGASPATTDDKALSRASIVM